MSVALYLALNLEIIISGQRQSITLPLLNIVPLIGKFFHLKQWAEDLMTDLGAALCGQLKFSMGAG